MKKKKSTQFSILGTTNWRSYAFYMAGTRAEDSGDSKTAERLYVRALAVDGNNIGARINLGGMLLAEDHYGNAVEQLQVAKHRAKTEDNIDDDALYLASYQLAVALHNIGRTTDAKEELDRLLERLNETLAAFDQPPALGVRTEAALKWMESRQWIAPLAVRIRARLSARMRRLQPKDETRRSFREQLQPAVLVMQIGLNVLLGKSRDDGELLKLDVWKPGATFQYNLACTYSLLAGASGKEEPERQRFVDASLRHLDFALRLRPVFGDWAKIDPSLETLRKNAGKELDKILAPNPKPAPPPAAPAKTAKAKTTAAAQAS